jgi:dipeptidyl-peptidase-4
VKFPRAGTANAIVDLGIVSVKGGAPRWVTWDLTHYAYLARVIWPAKGPLTLIVVGREQTVASVLAVDPATGGTRTLLVEKDPAWINVAPDALTWLPDGSGFLWMTESHGAWALEHRAADGSGSRQIVTADAGLRRVVGFSADGSEVVIEAANNAREHGVWRVAIAGDRAPAPVTTEGGVHHALAAQGLIAVRSMNRAGGRVAQVLRPGGARVELPSVAERPRLPVTTKLEEILAEDHQQFTALTRPHAFDAKVRYPVLLRIGGPERLVLDAMDAYVVDQWWADAGFIVVRTDGRGTPNRDRDWERVIAGDVLTLPINDQIIALKRLGARYPELDLARVGAIGAGAGGHLATIGAMIHPDAFAAAVAVSPITDWALLDTAYSERFMKTPALNPEGYRRANAASYAEQVRRPLLILAAPADDRVVFAHTLELLDALSAAGKSAEVATLPAMADPTGAIATMKVELAFLREHLGPPVRPAVMPTARSGEDEEEEERERARRATGDKDGDKDDKDRGKDRRGGDRK